MPEPSNEGPRPGPTLLATWVLLGLALVLVLGLFSIRCELRPDVARAYSSRTLPAEPEPEILPPEPLDDEYYPCSDCHEDEPANRTVRELEEDHEDLELRHGDNWCLHCHDADARDVLHLSDGARLEFSESWRLCGQCHGSKLEEWKLGVHGKRTGHWWGPKQVRPCVSCHDPHDPRFRPLEPEPPPIRPEQIAWKEAKPLEAPQDGSH